MSNRYLLTVLLISLGQACSSTTTEAQPPPPPPLQEGSMSSLSEALTRLASEAGDCKALEAQYKDGSGFHGWTVVEIAQGQVKVRSFPPGGGAEVSYTGELTPAECRALVGAAAAGRLWEVKPQRTSGVPDETRPLIKLKVGAQEFSVQLWDNEGRQVPAFQQTRDHFLAIAARISGGRVRY